MEELTPRQQTILGLVVREYVNSASPVSSRALVERYGLGVSTATVRNELAQLEELGYLTHLTLPPGVSPRTRATVISLSGCWGRRNCPCTSAAPSLTSFTRRARTLNNGCPWRPPSWPTRPGGPPW